MNSNNIYISPICSCVKCQQEFSAKGINTHYICSHTSNRRRKSYKGSNKFQVKCSCIYCNDEVSVQNLSRHHKRHFIESVEKICPSCQTTHSKNGTFCSRSCANKRPHSTISKQKISKSNKKRKMLQSNPKFSKASWCKVCGVIIRYKHNSACSSECRNSLFVEAGKKAAQQRVVRSKDEILLFELCKKYFTNVSHNDAIFNGWDADILIHDIKVAVLWNGPWHYKKMPHKNHSLLQVQNRDNIKINEILKLGWTPILFEDRYYTPKQAFDELVKRMMGTIHPLWLMRPK